MDMFQQDSVLLNSEDGDPASSSAAAGNAAAATTAGGGGMLERQKKTQARMNERQIYRYVLVSLISMTLNPTFLESFSGSVQYVIGFLLNHAT